MIRITSKRLSVADRKLIKRFCYFALNILVPKHKHYLIRKTDINIKFAKPGEEVKGESSVIGKKAKAWVSNHGSKNGRKKFVIVLNECDYNRRAKTDYIRIKKIILNLAHEITHTKQYMTGELFDYVDGTCRWRKEKYEIEDWNSDREYYDSPWEIEAFGREWGLFKMFKKELLKERKGKRHV